jgi:hypothetical protein
MSFDALMKSLEHYSSSEFETTVEQGRAPDIVRLLVSVGMRLEEAFEAFGRLEKTCCPRCSQPPEVSRRAQINN